MTHSVIAASVNAGKIAAAKQLVFIDAGIDGHEAIERALDADVARIVYDRGRPGLAQIAASLAGVTGLESIAIISHGDDGVLRLGTDVLTLDSLNRHAADLAVLGSALVADGQLSFYGCNVAASGTAFIEALKSATGRDVSASTNLTGAAELGGDWVLEVSTGLPAAALPANAAALAQFQGVLQNASTPISGAGSAADSSNQAVDVADTASDAAGNVYVTGYFRGTVSFGTLTLGGPATLVSNNASTDFSAFVVKYDTAGAVVWAKELTGTSTNNTTNGFSGQSIAVSSDGSKVVVGGNYTGTVDLNPDAGVASATNSSTTGFVVELNGSGAYQWDVHMTGTGNAPVSDVAIDTGGNVYATGNYNNGNTVHWSDGSTATLSSGNVNVPDVFVLKATATGTAGYVANITSATGTNGHASSTALAVDAAGNAYVAGYIDTNFNFGSIAVTATGYGATYLAKVNASGTFVDAEALGGTNGATFAPALINDIAITADGPVVTGWYGDGAKLIPGSSTAQTAYTAGTTYGSGPSAYTVSQTAQRVFVEQFDSSLNSKWLATEAPNSQGFSIDEGTNIAVDAAGNIVVTGTILGTGPYAINGSANATTTAFGSNSFTYPTTSSTNAYGYTAHDNEGFIWTLDPGTSSATTLSAGVMPKGSVSVGGLAATGNGVTVVLNAFGTIDADPSAGVETEGIAATDTGVLIRLTSADLGEPQNAAPTIVGAVAAQTVNDNSTVSPFSVVTIADTDSADLQTVTITLDSNAKGAFTAASLTATGFTFSAGVYTLTGVSAGAASTAIHGLVFDPADNRVAPGQTETTTFTIKTNDGSGDVSNALTTVVSKSINDSPTIAGATAGHAVNDNATVAPFSGVTITEVDPGQTQTVTVALDNAAKGVFTAASLAATGFVDSTGGVYTLSGFSAADATAKIRALVFDPTDNRVAPGQTETTTFSINTSDGSLGTADFTTTVISTSINDAPTAAASTQSMDEDGGRIAITLSATDPDSAVTLFTLAHLPANGHIFADPSGGTALGVGATITAGGSGPYTATVYFEPDADANGTVNLGYTATDGSATSAEVTATIKVAAVGDAVADLLIADEHTTTILDVLANDTFESPARYISDISGALHGTVAINDNGTAADHSDDYITYTSDAGFAGVENLTYTVTSGGTTETGSVTLTVDPVDDAPAFVNLDASTSYDEGTRIVLDDNATIIDSDTSAPYDGATLTLQRHGGANADDVFDSPLFSEGSVNFYDPVPSIDVPIGSYTLIDGVLVITFNAEATADRVDYVLQQITYANGNENLPPNIQIDYSFDDGSVAPATGHVTLHTNAVDDPPVIDGVSPVAVLQPGHGPVDLAPAIALSDVDSTTLDFAVISITQDHQASDVLAVDVGTSGLSATFDGVTGTLVLNGTATLDVYQAVLATLTYASTSADPASLAPSRLVDIVVHGDASYSNDAPINIYFAPGADLNGSGAGTGDFSTFVENGPAISIVDSNVDVFGGSYGVTSATIVLTNAEHGDVLDVGTLPASITSSIDTSVDGQITVTLSGSASAADYEAALKAITYSTGEDDPVTTLRDVTITFSDGNSTSDAVHSTIDVTAINDFPLASFTGGPYSAEEGVSLSLKGTGMIVADLDGGSSVETITLSVGEGILHATAGDSGVSIDSGEGTSSLVVSGSLAALNAFLGAGGTSTLSFVDHADIPSASTGLTLALSDNGNTGLGGPLFATATTTIDITAVNDAPVAIIASDTYTATEQTALDLKNTGLSVGDPDAGSGVVTVTLSVGAGTLAVTAGGSGAVVSGTGSSSVSISGTIAQINALLLSDVTSTISYFNGSDNPSATTLTLTVDDGGNTGTGGALTGFDTATINFDPINDAPDATITPASYATTAGVALDLKNNGLSVADPDAGSGVVTVTLSVGAGRLDVTAGNSGASVSGSGTASVSISGTIAQINALLLTDLASTVSYINTSATPPATTSLTLAINDGGNTGTGGVLTDSDSAVINSTGTGPSGVDIPPSFLDLEHELKKLSEAASTHSARKVADIVLHDPDGHTTLSLTGADAFRFTIKGDELFLKAGAHLDFETNPKLDVTVNADGGGAHLTTSMTISIIDAPETIVGTKHSDKLTGTGKGEAIEGRGGNDTIKGGGGADTITGGHGADIMTGGHGKDVFVFRDGDLPAPVLNDQLFLSLFGPHDTITDFKPGKDKIDLHLIDANVNKHGNQAFHFDGENGLSGHSQQLVYRYEGTAGHRTTIVMGDTTGDGLFDVRIVLNGHLSLHASDFIL